MPRHGSIAVWVCLLGASLSATARAAAPEDIEFFEKHVRPILVARCHDCHSSAVEEPDAGLALDTQAGFTRGGDSGPVVTPGDLATSRLLTAVSYEDVDLQMPPDGKLPDEELEHLKEWVRRGAPWPEEAGVEPTAKPKSAFDLHARKAAHWAWQPLRETSPPQVNTSAWAKSDVDRFILAKLEAAGLAPAGEADRNTWLRRVTFDLIGLPPTIEEIEAFRADASPDAREKVIDRLLASPHFGERWARHWLDLVRYAETKGHEFDYPAPNAYQYRDYVIRALNADVPYDQFAVEHLAGDLLSEPRTNPTDGFNESIIGPGFWLLGEEIHSPVDTRQDQADRFDNRIDVFSKTFLGLTVACARCHDHKFDAISAKDYYALFSVLESSTGRSARFETIEQDKRIAQEIASIETAAQAPLKRALGAALRPTADQLAAYLSESNGASLDPTIRAAWKEHLTRATHDPADPFHAFTKAQSSSPAVAACEVAGAENRAAEATVIVDYARCPPEQWLPDDTSYGSAPRLAGDADCRRDAPRFIEQSAAVFDTAWDVRRLAPNQQLEPGAVAGAPRAGRTLCTPNFTVRGKLYCLVRGAGQIYAGVDQHALVLGPLHGVLVGHFDTGGAWQWIERDLTEYEGHVAHVEFTPAAGAELAVRSVVQGNAAPPLPESGEVIPLEPGTSRDAAAAAYQKRFADMLTRWEESEDADEATRTADARLANWILEHGELFSATPEQAFAEFVTIAQQTHEARSRALASIRPESRLCLSLQDLTGIEKPVYLRGSPKNPGELTSRRGPEAIFGDEPLDESVGSGRLELARQMVDPVRNPLFARVYVNRIWHHLFGRGIVASVDNFGVMGDAPTHPELLDHLALRFAAEGWSTKRLIRELVLSTTYGMDATASPTADAVDPQDLLLHRMRVRRLEGEAIRDAMLAVCGSLNRTSYGPSQAIYLNEFMDGRGRPASSGPLDGANRRSIYIEVRRNFLSPLMLAFDAPIPFSTVGRRNVSNVPAQSLALLNDPLVHELSERWAKRITAECADERLRVERMYLEAFGRTPDDAELEKCLAFVQSHDAATAWQQLAHALWNVKEFVFIR